MIHFRASKNKSERINARFNFMSLSYLMIRSVSFNGSWNYPDRHRGSLLSFDLFSPPAHRTQVWSGFEIFGVLCHPHAAPEKSDPVIPISLPARYSNKILV